MTLFSVKTLMARASAAIMLILLLWGCGRVPRVGETPPPYSRLPFVRVLLSEAARQHTFSADGEMAIDCYKGSRRLSYYSRQPITVQAEQNRLAITLPNGSWLDSEIDRLILSPRGKKTIIACDNRRYRGLHELTASSGQIKLINIVNVDDYLFGVVPLEIGPTPESQFGAIEAQAVAARTYAMGHLDQYGDFAGYDLKADVLDQVYDGAEAETELVNQAVSKTRGQVLVYGDEIIDAYYHSTCGGYTDDIEDVWDKEARPYLKMVCDSSACRDSKYYTWKEEFTGEQLTLRLEQYLSRERGSDIRVGRLTDIRVLDRTPGGRAAAVTFETTTGRYTFDKEKVRWVIGQSGNPDGILRSANFTLDIGRDAGGEITSVSINGRGYGHGIGMCQMGARGLAENSITYDSILALYYQGTKLKRIY